MKDFLRILLLAMVICCWSCSGGGEDVPTPTPTPKPETNKIEISTSAPVVEQKGGTATISFTTNAAWTANVGTSTSWLKVSPTSGVAGSHTLTITTEENNTYDERNATLTIKAGNASQNITVTQKQKDGLIVTSNKVEVGAEGGDFSIETKANVNVTYEIEEAAKDWISASESRGLTAKNLKFNAKANDKTERRQGNIILKGGDGLTETVTVYQAGEEVSLVLTTEKDMTIGSEGGTLKIELQSNSEIKMEELDADWLRQSSSRAMSAYTYYIEVDANETYDERNASITFVSGEKKQIVTVTQKQMDALIVNSNKVEVGADGGDFFIEAKANVSVTFEIEESAKDWIIASESRALTAKTLNFTAKANDKTERRQGNVILKGGDGLTEIVTVYQEGEKPSLVISSDDVVVNSEGDTVKIELKSNVEYTMVLPEVDWISKEESRTISAYTHYLIIAPNETYDQRSAVVYFQNETENLRDSINITQLQKDAIIVAKNEYTVEAESSRLKFSVNTNVKFNVSVSVDWIKQVSASRGLEEKPLSFYIEKNDSTIIREGEIMITYEDLKQTIKVVQKSAIDYEAVIAKEREVLIEFYKATGGDNWKDNTNWCSDKPVGEWYGVETNAKGQVYYLKMFRNNLSGYIPESIGMLTELLTLNLHGNSLNGNIPENIGKLTKIESIDLDSNSLSGNIPESIGDLTELEDLSLSYNELTGELPKSFEKLVSLKSLGLDGNKWNGDFPKCIWKLTQLRYLMLQGCGFTGELSEEIGNLKELRWLWLYRNNLSGKIPESIGNLKKLTSFTFGSNKLSGTIPENIGKLSSLQELSLVDNNLEGRIPESIGDLTELTSLDLSYNQLSGNIPECIGKLTKLTSLCLLENQLSGNIPESIGNLSGLKALLLRNNLLSGNIPESIGNLIYLKSIWLNNNQLSGTIPMSLTKLNVWKDYWACVLAGNNLDTTGVQLWGPNFRVTDIEGNTISSEEEYAKNKLTVIYSWASWCCYSRSFNPMMEKLYNKYKDKGLEVIGSCSTWRSSSSIETAYIKENKIPWRNFMEGIELGGVNNIPSAHYGVIPAVTAIDENQQIVFQTLYGNTNISQFKEFIDNYFDPNLKELYTSTDFLRDGEVQALQNATEGNGINLIFMGEGFVDKDMEPGGLYESRMKESMEHFFSIEPYKTMRNRFNVYSVKVVSPNAEFRAGATQRINQDNSVCFDYALKIPDADKQPLMITVVYNDYFDRSFCVSYSDGSFVSYIMAYSGDPSIIAHESGGHGFGGLMDEYVEAGYGELTLPEDKKSFLDDVWTYTSRGANVDWRNDVSTVKWAHFLRDSRYAGEALGLYEGAYQYGYGVYRPTENSMMRYNDSPFNAPSREQIYKRIMQRSEGENWKYDYEEFVKYDEINRNNESRSAIKPLTEAERKEYIKNHRPPTFIKGTWRDAMKNSKSKVVVPLR